MVEDVVGERRHEIDLPVEECFVIATGLLLALTGWAALATATAGVLSLASVLIPVVIVAAVATGLVWRRVHVVSAPAAVLTAVGVLVLGLLIFLPGFPDALAMNDPGVYVSHALGIARTGSLSFTDPFLTQLAHPAFTSGGAIFPAMWVSSQSTTVIVPQFYHLWPSLLAVADLAGGRTALTNLTPLIGALSLVTLYVLVRRLAGATAGVVAAMLLATSLPQLWQSREPTTEVLAQLLVLLTLLLAVIAVDENWWPAAAGAGLTAGVAWLERPDGLLVLGLGIGVCAVALACRRGDRIALAFLAGAAVTLPSALWQAYHVAVRYTLSNGIPSFPKFLVALVALGVAVVVVRRALARGVDVVVNWLSSVYVQRRLGLLLSLLVIAGLMLAAARPYLFAPGTQMFSGHVIRTFDEWNLRRLTWFTTVAGMGLGVVGLLVVLVDTWRLRRLLVALPLLTITPLYLYQARIAPQLLWWVRRWVPVTFPLLAAMAALAVAWALAVRVGGRRWLALPALLVAVGVAATTLHQMLPVRRFPQDQGTWSVVDELAALGPAGHTVYLFQRGTFYSNHLAGAFAAPLWMMTGSPVSTLPTGAHGAAYISQVRAAFPGDRLLVVGEPGGSPPAGCQQVATVTLDTWLLNESVLHVPSTGRNVVESYPVWLVR